MKLTMVFFKTAKRPPKAHSGGIKITEGEMGNAFQRSEPTWVFYLSLSSSNSRGILPN